MISSGNANNHDQWNKFSISSLDAKYQTKLITKRA